MEFLSNKPLLITDTILRDAHQSQAATRMTIEDMLPALEQLDAIGYYSLECWGGATFLHPKTLMIMGMGIVAFGFGTAGGVLLAKFMNLFLKEKINPLIGSAGVSAVPMAARVSQTVGQKENPGNFLLMHAMGPNVAGVIGSAIAAGVLISLYG